MSAPWEVFVAYQITAPKEDGLAMPQDTFLGPNPNVRYLRADLTCGECKFHTFFSAEDGEPGKHTHPCPHAWWDDEFSTWREASDYRGDGFPPACMAFQPRTERIECGEE